MIKYLICLLLLISFFFSKKVLAADLNINCDSEGCSPTISSGIFPDDHWYPGRTVNRQIKISNTGTNILTISNRSQNSVTTGNLDNVMLFSIIRNSDNHVIWSGTLHDFYGVDNINLGSLLAGKNEDYRYTMTMKITAGNEYQSKSTGYNLVLAFSGNSSGTSSTTDKVVTPGGRFVMSPAIGFNEGILGTQENIGSGSATVGPKATSWWQWILKIILQVLEWFYEIFRRIFAFFYPATHK